MRAKLEKLAYAALLLSAQAHSAGLTIDEQEIDFGEQYQFSEIRRDVQVWNRTDSTIRLHEAPSKSPSVSIGFEKAELAPGQSTLLHIRAALENRSGTTVIVAPFEADENGKTENYRISLSGFTDSILDEPKPKLDMGVVDTKVPVEKSISLNSETFPELRIVRVSDAPGFVEAKVGEDGRTLHVKPRDFSVLGYRRGIIKLVLASKLQPEAWVNVLMDVHGNVVPDQNPLNFDLQRPSMLHAVRLQLVSRDSEPFRIGNAKIDGSAHVDIEQADCLPKARPDCHALMLKLRKDQPHGIITGTLVVELPDSTQTLQVTLGGLFLGDQIKVHSLDKPDDADAAPRVSQGERRTDLSQALRKAVSEHVEGPPPGKGPLLKWTVANEAGIYGYAIFRAKLEKGPYLRVNNPIVRAHNEGDNNSANYQWRDTSAQAGEEYWYYISIFYSDGRKQQFTGPQKIVAK